MSTYINQDPLFMEPKVIQHGGHMIMTNVAKPGKTKFVSIDTKFRDNYSVYGTVSVANFNMSLPDRITDVRSMMVCSAEIPMSMYNFSDEIGNTYFQLSDPSNNSTSSMIHIAGGNYDATALKAAINAKILAANGVAMDTSGITVDISGGHMTIVADPSYTGTIKFNFAVNSDGSADKYNFKRKLGWFLGFRSPSYTVSASTVVKSENFADTTGLRYVYLVVDEFGKGVQNSFVSPMPSSLVRKNILAKIIFNKSTFPFGSVIPANNFNGYLLSDRRGYNGKIDVQKLNIQLVDEIGSPVNLNGMDFSFCLEVEYE